MTACTYLTTDELSQRIKYDSRTIRDRLKDSVLLEGRHYIRPFGGRKTLYIWEQIEADMAQHSAVNTSAIPLAVKQRLMAAAARPSFKLRATGSPFDSKDKLKARGYRWDGDAKVWFCSLGSEAALTDELAWLRAEVYGGRRALVEVEGLEALTRYSQRIGRVERREIQISS